MRGRIGWIPYFRTPKADAENIAAATGTHLLSPITMNVAQFLDDLMSCEAVVAEAMHGAILADALRVPWIGCRICSSLYEGETSFFKWRDWQESLGIDTSLENVVPDWAAYLPRGARVRGLYLAKHRGATLVARLLKEQHYTLSADEHFSRAQDRMMEATKKLQSDFT